MEELKLRMSGTWRDMMTTVPGKGQGQMMFLILVSHEENMIVTSDVLQFNNGIC